jgi:outer membrane protein OmpA-like peptidoglycan-associated protein
MKFSKQISIIFSFIISLLLLIGCGNNKKISKNDEEKKIEELIIQRDEAIKIALNISKNSKKLDSKKLNAIQNIENARDEAIYVSLGIQQENRELKSKVDKMNREYNQDIQYYEKTIIKLKKVEDRDQLKKELKHYKSENRKLQSNIKKVRRSIELEIKDIRRETQFKIRTINNLISQVQKQKNTKATLERKLAKAKNQTDKAIKLAIDINKKLNTKIAQLLNNSYTKLNIPKVEFKSDSTILTEQSSQLLDKIVSIIKKYPEYNYEIQGHTDSHGNESYNLKLSTMRAKNINDYLLSKGIEETSLSFKGFGSSRPIADNDTKDGRDLNRRVLIKVK